MRVERQFRIRLAMEELMEVKQLGQLLDLVQAKLASTASCGCRNRGRHTAHGRLIGEHWLNSAHQLFDAVGCQLLHDSAGPAARLGLQGQADPCLSAAKASIRPSIAASV